MIKDKKYIFIVIVFFILILLIIAVNLCFSVRSNISDSSMAKVIINDNIIYVEVPQTKEERIKGLGGRDFLAKNQGMLFTFTEKQKTGFSMREVRFPLDIIWINDNQIMEITQNIPVLQANQDIMVYYPKTAVNYVLEVNAGYAKLNNLQIGDFVEFNL